MRWSLVAASALVLTACKGKDDVDASDTDEPQTPAVAFHAEVDARAVEGSLSDDIVHAHQAVNALLASAALVVTDPNVHHRLKVHNGTPSAPPPFFTSHCWTGSTQQSQFTISYEGCETAMQTLGGVFVRDHPSGPLIFQFLPLDVKQRQVAGTLALDATGAPQETWGAYDSAPTAPGPAVRSPFGVTTPQGTSNLTFDGGSAVSFFHGTWAMWGVASVTGPTGATTEVLVGGTNPDALAQPVSPGPSVATFDLAHNACRCPGGGLSTYDVELVLGEISLDIDDLEVEPDDVDDPVFSFEVVAPVLGRAVVQNVGCGEYDVIFEPEAAGDLVIVLPKDDVGLAAEAACNNVAGSDAERCLDLRRAANDAGDLSVTVSEELLEAALQEAVARQFDFGWCTT